MSRLLDKLLARDEHVCPWWMAWTFDNPLRKGLHDPREILGHLVKEGMTIADIGCGMGYFSIAMARMAGPQGRVFAVDLQQKMLDRCLRRARRIGVGDRITTVLCRPDDVSLTDRVDFALAFWMVHEVKGIPRFFGQLFTVLKPGGKMLYAEPKVHVTQKRFDEIVGHALAAGFSAAPGPKVGLSRAVVLERGA